LAIVDLTIDSLKLPQRDNESYTPG